MSINPAPRTALLNSAIRIGKPIRSIVSFLLKGTVSAVLLYLAFRHVNWVLLSANVRKMRAGWMIMAFLLFLIQALCGAIRWQRIAKVCALKLTVLSAIRYSLIANFFNQGLPTAVGGDAVRIFLAGRATGKTADSSYSVIIDRCLGGMACALLVIAVLPWTFSFMGNLTMRAALAASSFGFLFLFGGLLSSGFLPQGIFGIPKLARHAKALSAFVSRFFSLPLFAEISFNSILIHLLGIVVVWCLAHAIGVALTVYAAIALVPVILLIAMIPISIAGWGVRETATASILAYAGITPSDGVMISILYGATLFALGLIGGGIWAMDRHRPPSTSG